MDSNVRHNFVQLRHRVNLTNPVAQCVVHRYSMAGAPCLDLGAKDAIQFH